MRYLKTCLIFLLLPLSGAPLGAECYDAEKAQTPSSRYKISGNGVVTDSKTGLTWMRCALGMEWNGKTCNNTPDSTTWSGAKILMLSLNHEGGYAGFRDWRLPSKEELLTLAEKQCFEPAINSEIFPNTPNTGFWSGSADTHYDNRAWLVFFRHGSAYMGNQEQEWAVRAVRTAK